MNTSEHARRDAVRGLLATAIAYVVTGIVLSLLQASSITRLTSISVMAGALLPVVYATKSKLGSISTIARRAVREAGQSREARFLDVTEPDIVSIVPATRTGPITFEITTLQLPSNEPHGPARCKLHKGIIHADAVSCKRCGTVYCKACASQLASLEEPCWACHYQIEW